MGVVSLNDDVGSAAATELSWVQFGCGLCAPPEWRNFDCSPTLRLQRLPVVGRFVPSGPYGRFPPQVAYGDIVTGLPVPRESVALLYSSHTLEHLSLSDLRASLRNCRNILAPRGCFRMVLPDLEYFIDSYRRDGSPDAAIRFMRDTILGQEHRSRSLVAHTREWFGGSRHLWMWDFRSLRQELEAAGFTRVRRAEYHDSQFAAFQLVEHPDRWNNSLGIECSR